MSSFFRRHQSALLVGLLFAGSGAAYADDHPRLAPARDVTVTYHLSAPAPQGAGTDGNVKVYFSGSGDMLRIDSADGRGMTILDRPKQLVTLVMLERKLYANIRPQHGLHNPFMLDLGMQYSRAGQQTIAGVSCDQWNIQTAHGKATACVTQDGVILAENGVDADGAEGTIRAMTVAYGDLPTSTFEPPAGFQEITPRTSPRRAPASGSQSSSPTPAPVPEGGAAGDSAVPAPGHIAAEGTPAESSDPVASQTVAPGDSSQPAVSNDSAGDGTVSAPDQPPSGPSNGNMK